VFSLNAPVPGTVARLAGDLRARLLAFDRLRDRHTLVVKRFEERDDAAVRRRLRRAMHPTPAFEARTDGIGVFADPPAGAAPVVYLRVESPGLRDLHDRLVDEFGAIEGLEGEAFVPHVTLARGGSLSDARALAGTPVDDVTWTVSRLVVWDPTYREQVGSVSLPTG
jgi:2'-5' RNA ligase